MTKTNKLSSVAALMALAGLLAVNTAQAADPRNGAKLYNMHCSSCHSVNGRGGMPGVPDFSRGGALFKPDAKLVSVIEQGVGVMPAYRGLMSTRDILDVIAHLRTFR